jgi:alcohol dehydrogenase class IV
MSFRILQPARIHFGRGAAGEALALARTFGPRGILVHGAAPGRARAALGGAWGTEIVTISVSREPTLAALEAAVATARPHWPDWVLAVGGGSALDLGKALAALLPAPGGALDHLEVVGRGLPLAAEPLPFLAVPTTAGTGAEVTRNAVIGLPEHGRKVSLRDDRMIARAAFVDPALTDGCPWPVTLASGLDALTQLVEPHVSPRATPYTDALTRPLIGPTLAALRQLAGGEDRAARDAMAWASLCGGLALSNAGLGAVHGLAGVIGGITPAAHGAICGALLGPVLAANRAAATGEAQARLSAVCADLASVLCCTADEAPEAIALWARAAGLPGLEAQGLDPALHAEVAEAARLSSSMKANPVALAPEALVAALAAAG